VTEKGHPASLRPGARNLRRDGPAVPDGGQPRDGTSGRERDRKNSGEDLTPRGKIAVAFAGESRRREP